MRQTIRKLDFCAPIKTVSEANHGRRSEHWSVKRKRRLAQQQEINAVMFNALRGRTVALPCVVRITRIGPRKLDGDNLQSSMKGIRDEIARMLKVDDGDEDKVTFDYFQMPVGIKQYAVKIQITSNGAGE